MKNNNSSYAVVKKAMHKLGRKQFIASVIAVCRDNEMDNYKEIVADKYAEIASSLEVIFDKI